MKQEEDAEEVVLSRWGKMKQWWDIGSTMVKGIKLAMLGFKLLFVGSTAAVVVGQATDTNPLNQAATSVGLVQPSNTDIVGNDAMYEELSNLIEDVERLEAEIAQFDHVHAPPIVGARGPAGPQGSIGPEGPQGIRGDKGRPGIDGNRIATQEMDERFNNHVDLLH